MGVVVMTESSVEEKPPRCAWRNGARRPLPYNLYLSPQQWTRQAGGAAAAVDAEFATGEGADVEAGGAETFIGFAVFFEGEQTPAAESKNVAGQHVALGGVDLDEVVTARLEQFDGFDCEPWQVDQSGVFVEQADQRHQVQAGGGSGAVGQRRGKNFDAFGRQQVA